MNVSEVGIDSEFVNTSIGQNDAAGLRRFYPVHIPSDGFLHLFVNKEWLHLNCSPKASHLRFLPFLVVLVSFLIGNFLLVLLVLEAGHKPAADSLVPSVSVNLHHCDATLNAWGNFQP